MNIDVIRKARNAIAPRSPKAVLLALATRADESGSCYPSTALIQQDAGLGRSALFDALRWLKENGHITIESGKGRHHHSTYIVHPIEGKKGPQAGPFTHEKVRQTTRKGPPAGLEKVRQPDTEVPREVPSRTKVAKPLTLPFADDEFVEVWEEWEQHRKEKRKPLTPTSTKKQFEELKAMGLRRAITAINFSISKGWTGIFEPKDQTPKSNKPKSEYTQF
jgi:hypothetical protein